MDTRSDRLGTGASRLLGNGQPLATLRTSALAAALATAVMAAPAVSRGDDADPDPDAKKPPSTYAERITITATGAEQRLEDMPLPITVITHEEIVDSQEESVADLLRRTPGVTIMRTGDEGSTTALFMRGTNSNQTLALFDGVRLNSPYFAGYDWSLLPSAGVERIEVARGPYSALWGADAVGGVVNVLPQRGGDGLSASALGEIGEDDWQRLEGSVSGSPGKLDLLASLFDREGRGVPSNSDFANTQILFDGGYNFSDSGRVSLLFQDLDSETGIPFSSPGLPSPDRRQDTRQRLYAAPLHVQPGRSWNLELVPSFVERELVFRDPDDFFTQASDTNADTWQARLASHHGFAAGDQSHTFTWGGEWREDTVDDRSFSGSEVTNLDGERTSVASVFAQDLWQATGRLTLIAGVRYDDADQWGSEVSPRISLGYKVHPSVELRAGYGEAFRQPSVGELFFPGFGNRNLEAERSDSAELGVALDFARHRIDATAFATDVENLIEFSFSPFGFVNRSKVEIRGAELGWSVPVTDRILSFLQGTWLDTKDEAGLSLLRRPEWSSSWTLTGLVMPRLRGDLAILYVGSRADLDPMTFGRATLGSHTTANLAAGYEVTNRLEITVRLQNVTDEDYDEVAGYPAPGRRFSGGLRFTM